MKRKGADIRGLVQMADRARQIEPMPPEPAATIDLEATPRRKASEPRGVLTTIHLDQRILLLLQRLAGARRAQAKRGRASVSAVVNEIVERLRPEIEAEIARLESEF